MLIGFIATPLFLCAVPYAQLPHAGITNNRDLMGWRQTRWGMSEQEVRMALRGRWRSTTKQEREDSEGHDIYTPIVAPNVTLAGHSFVAGFGFRKTDRRLVSVMLHSGTQWLKSEVMQALFDRITEHLKVQFGSPNKVVRNDVGHMRVYPNSAVWELGRTEIMVIGVKVTDVECSVAVVYSALPTAVQ